MGYATPTGANEISCSWQCHRDRTPSSSEPGTDYAGPNSGGYGSPALAPGNGTVVDIKTSNSGGTGRFVTIDLDDGRRTRSLHLSSVAVSVGQRVSRGQRIGAVGGSANGSDRGVGSHVHQTLWGGHYYRFGRDATVDFARFVGGEAIGGNQRQAGSSGVNGRSEPRAGADKKQFLDPGTVGDFNGWIRGEAVEGNNVWFRGAHSGDWFWSGGFTDTGVHDLPDLNPATPAPIGGNQRKVGSGGANGRPTPATNGNVTQTLSPGTVGDFDGWIAGQNVEGNNVWFRGAHSGDWFWSGGFEDKGTHDLADLRTPEPPTPPVSTARTVGANAANVRSAPERGASLVGSEAPGAVVEMDAWAEGERVEEIGAWFRRKAGGWMWAGGFTIPSTDGLTRVDTPTIPNPANPDNPRGLPTYEPVYPRAKVGIQSPLGFTDCEKPVTRSPRTTKGTPPVATSGVIDRFIIHYTDATNDQADYFSHCNDRSVAPTFYLRTNGETLEFIRPGAKPATTGPEWNWRSISVETQTLTRGPEGRVADVQLEELAQMIAWLAEYDGKSLDGAPVSFKIDRQHVISHKEALPGTDCPGQYITARMDAIVARAQAIYDERHPDPTPGPDTLTVPRKTIEGWRDRAFTLYDEIGDFLDGAS